VFGESILQRRDCIEHGRTGTGRQRFDQRWINRGKQFSRVRIHEAFDFPIEEPGVEERIENRFLRHEFIPNGVADRLCQARAMAWNHPLWPDCDPEKL